MIEHLYTYKATLLYVYDGDSITSFKLDFGFGFSHIIKRGEGRSIRLYGVNAEPLSTDLGKQARDFLKQFEGQEVLVKSYKDKTGKYGRYLFEVFAEYEGKLQNINKVMLEKGLVKNYNNDK